MYGCLHYSGQKVWIICLWVGGRGGGGVGGTPLYKPYRYVPPQRVGFLRLFSLKTGTEFALFGLESCPGGGVYFLITG